MFRALILLTVYICYVHPDNGFDKENPFPTNEEQYQTAAMDENKTTKPCNEESRRTIPGLLINPTNRVEESNFNKLLKNKYQPGNNIPETIASKSRRDLSPGILGNEPNESLKESEQNKQKLSINPAKNISPNTRILRVDESENYPPTWRSSPTNQRPLDADENRHLTTRNVDKKLTSENISNPYVYRNDKRRDVENVNKFPYQSNFESFEDTDDSEETEYLKHVRVCYACSSLSDPSCWNPDKRTTVKYCKKKHKNCLKTTYTKKGTTYIVRDCGKICPSGVGSCTLCSSDLCNSAPLTITNISATIAMVLGTFLIKY